MAVFTSTVYFEPIYTAREIEYLNDDKTFQTTWSFEGNLKLWSQNWRRITRKYITRTFLIKINIRRYSNNLFYVLTNLIFVNLKNSKKRNRTILISLIPLEIKTCSLNSNVKPHFGLALLKLSQQNHCFQQSNWFLFRW